MVPKKKRGRPATGQGIQVGTRWAEETIAAIDEWAAKQEDQPGRSEAIRRLVEAGLAAVPTTRKRLPEQAGKAEKMAAAVVDRELAKKDERGHVKARRRKALLSGQDDLAGRKKL